MRSGPDGSVKGPEVSGKAKLSTLYPTPLEGISLGVALLSAILAVVYWGIRSRVCAHFPGLEIKVLNAEYPFVVLVATSITANYEVLASRFPVRRWLIGSPIVLPLAAVLGISVYSVGMYQFGGWDEGAIAHVGAAYAHGLKPYVDYQCSMPPMFMAGVRIASVALGLRWSSFAGFTAIFAVLTLVWLFLILLKTGVPWHWAVVIALTVETGTMLAAPFWWFNSTSSIAVVLLTVSAVACLDSPTILTWISLAFSLSLVLTSKPNSMLASLSVFVLFLPLSNQRWKAALLAVGSGAAVAAAICLFGEMPPNGVMASYAELAKIRANPLKMAAFQSYDRWSLAFAVLLAALSLLTLALIVAGSRIRRQIWPLLIICALATLSSLEMVCTNNEMKTSDLMPMLVASALILHSSQFRTGVLSWGARLLRANLSLFLVASLFFGFHHGRLSAIGGGYFEPFPTRTVKSGFFTGLEASPSLLRIMRETEIAVSTFPSKNVFFGPRVEFEYAVLDRRPQRNMPLLWDPGLVFSKDRLPEMLADLRSQSPDLMIFHKNDFPGIGCDTFFDWANSNYDRIDFFSDVTVFERRRPSDQAP